MPDLYLNILPIKTKKAFLSCAELPFLKEKGWYLAGGTALAMQVGHRQSVDLDFFIPQFKFNEIILEKKLLATKKWQTTYRETGTIYGKYLDAKMSFIAYPFFKPGKKRIQYKNISVIIPEDIAVMKIIAISQRGKKRDFFDLYWYCHNREPLAEIIPRVYKQYPGLDHNLNHIIKSLIYFEDAENDPEPKIFFTANWREVKKFFRQEIKRIFDYFI